MEEKLTERSFKICQIVISGSFLKKVSLTFLSSKSVNLFFASNSKSSAAYMTKSKKIARTFSSLFLFLFDEKNRLAISEMVSAQSLHKVLVDLKKKWPKLFPFLLPSAFLPTCFKIASTTWSWLFVTFVNSLQDSASSPHIQIRGLLPFTFWW